MKETTGYHRLLAQKHAERLEWALAAEHWQKAIDLYPKPYPKLGAYAEADIKEMAARRDACIYSARREETQA